MLPMNMQHLLHNLDQSQYAALYVALFSNRCSFDPGSIAWFEHTEQMNLIAKYAITQDGVEEWSDFLASAMLRRDSL